MRRALPALALGAALLSASAAHGQFFDVVIDPGLGNRPTFGPGGYISNGFGYEVYGPKGRGYMPGLYVPPNDLGNGPSPYFSPIFNTLGARPLNAPAAAPRPAVSPRGRRWFRRR